MVEDRKRFAQIHDEVQRLLPWYLTGRLEGVEQERVADHLADCDACRTELRTEQALRRTVAVADAEVEADLGWAALRARAAPVPRRRAWPGAARAIGAIAARPRIAAAVMAAQAALLIGMITLAPPIDRPASYHALAAAPAPRAANLIVMFQPQARAADIIALLAAGGGRIVDGPTRAGAFVVAVPPENRAALLRQLRASAQLRLAEPLDP